MEEGDEFDDLPPLNPDSSDDEQSSDSEDDDYVPNSQSSSGNEDAGVVEEFNVNGDNKTTANVNLQLGAGKRNKRKQCHKNTSRKSMKKEMKRKSHDRNYTHDMYSKMECCDIDEILQFVLNPPECCEKRCITKFQTYKNRAVAEVSRLRHNRFAGKIDDSMKNLQLQSHPG